MARELTAAGTIATVEAGAHLWRPSPTGSRSSPGELLVSSGLGAAGFALPAAIAAQLAQPDRRVICFTGAGGLVVVRGRSRDGGAARACRS